MDNEISSKDGIQQELFYPNKRPKLIFYVILFLLINTAYDFVTGFNKGRAEKCQTTAQSSTCSDKK